ncbi:MAG TPA: glutamate synthase-related protein [Methanobacterium sp.]|nr:glutamate synthase-related protein [Methanobacterium sp.]
MVVEQANLRIKISDSEENRRKCRCPICPSYPQCGGEILFCGTNASKCDVNTGGCLCDTCSVYYEQSLKGLYYCTQVETGESKTLMRKKRTDEDEEFYQSLVDIREESLKGESLLVSMGSQKKLPYTLEDIHFIPAQINKIPLNEEDEVNNTIIIGKNSEKPLKLSSPILISGMSFGAVSKNVKLVIMGAASQLEIGYNSGEGGLTDEEKIKGWKHRIMQYSTGRFGITSELLKKAAGVEIRFGQGAYPGKGSYLPPEKMTKEVARVRDLEPAEGSYSPAHHTDINSGRDVEEKISWLKDLTGGVPVGAKIGCGDVKRDVEILADAGVDFITLDGFGGGTGATDSYVRENVGIPVFAALPQAYQTIKDMGLKDKVSLIASGGLRRSADFAKCLSLGADAVYIGTAALIAINCQQYRICYSGLCPTGVTTQNTQLVKQIDIDEGVKRLTNYIRLCDREVSNLTRIVGKDDVNKLDRNDIISVNRDLAEICGIRWLNGEYI